MSKLLLEQIANTTDSTTAGVAIQTIAKKLLEAESNQERKNLGEMRKLVQYAIVDRLLPARNFDERLNGLEAAWLELCEMFRPYLPPEVWAKIGGKVEQNFAKARLQEGLTK